MDDISFHPPLNNDYGLFEIFHWTPQFPLRKSTLVLRKSPPPSQHWIPAELLAASRTDDIPKGGPTIYAVGLNPPPDKSLPVPDSIIIEVATAHYGDYRAVRNLLKNRDLHLPLMNRARSPHGLEWLIANSPPSSIGLAVNLVSVDDQITIIQRSGSVGANRHRWMMGIGETLDPPRKGRTSILHCIRKAVSCEAGVQRQELSDIQVGWIGFDLLSAQLYLVAHVRTRIPASELHLRILSSTESREHSQVGFEPLSLSGIGSLGERIERDPSDWVTGSSAALRSLRRFYTDGLTWG